MNSFLLFLLKSTLSLSLLYLAFSVLMRKETFFKLNRMTLLFIVIISAIIPFLYLPQPIQPVVLARFEHIFTSKTIIEEPVQQPEIPVTIQSSVPVSETKPPIAIPTRTILLFVYLSGVFISLLMLIYSIISVLLLFRKAHKTDQDGIRLMIVPDDVPAFSFGRYILISQHDFDTNPEAIITHEQSHIRLGHFYDLILMELVKIIYWFNPLVYRIVRDLKEIQEFQADDHTLISGIDATKYQLLIIQKCVGHQKFALANSFNHCQIKNRITMMNKQKTSKAWRWKVATFLPLHALLLMAFGRTGEKVPSERIVSTNSEKALQQESVGLINEIDNLISFDSNVVSQDKGFKPPPPLPFIIEIKKEGIFVFDKLSSMEELIKNAGLYQKNYPGKNIHLLVDESIPYARIDEIREALEEAKVYHVTQSSVNSDEIIYFAGDVTEMAKFTQGKWNDWIGNQLKHFAEGKPNGWGYRIAYSFIIDKNGKVRDGHIIKGSDYPEINAAMEKILTQIPNWKPARRGSATVSVYNRFSGSTRIVQK